MVPWTLLDAAAVPAGGGTVLKLFRRGDEFSIRLDGNELMNSRLAGSEEALATLARARLPDRPGLQVLVGGLGMGFTLRAALSCFPPDARIVVAELVPAILAWARGPLAALHGPSLDDPRVALVVDDVAALIRAARARYDGILLDVDNGPDGLTRTANDGLYGPGGLLAAHAALRPGGILAVWSATPAEGFGRAMARAGFVVEDVGVRARVDRGARHRIWLGRRPGGIRPRPSRTAPTAS